MSLKAEQFQSSICSLPNLQAGCTAEKGASTAEKDTKHK